MTNNDITNHFKAWEAYDNTHKIQAIYDVSANVLTNHF
jgi:hypothetical protein